MSQNARVTAGSFWQQLYQRLPSKGKASELSLGRCLQLETEPPEVLPQRDKLQAYYCPDASLKLPLLWHNQPLDEGTSVVVESQGIGGYSEGNIDVWISLRNKSPSVKRLEASAVFFDERGVIIGSRRYWQKLKLPPDSTVIFVKSSYRARIEAASIQLRQAERQ
ncbi:hypothetical protein [Gilvimarinus sp. DA14]|uniref:hypothetical protein n=1 Tax=Gilvimarinus sp. DA14 TaxID=2956798 RepID=UPI0020B89B1E|nr:hypothetical protein [Gilvimarinus sp. DA14]UTF61448.1 hypothetical protein NHM04_06530 [Gilvimarinus sp. DA14]